MSITNYLKRLVTIPPFKFRWLDVANQQYDVSWIAVVDDVYLREPLMAKISLLDKYRLLLLSFLEPPFCYQKGGSETLNNPSFNIYFHDFQ